MPRSEWAGETRPPLGLLPDEEVKFLLVHHSASGNGYAEDDVAPLLRSFYDFHTGIEKGWPDIAYNFLIDRFGRVWEGRAGSINQLLQGSATGGNQGFSQLVCLIGDYSNELPDPQALESLRLTLAWLSERADVDTTPGATATFVSRGSNRHPANETVTTPTITGHRTMSQTSCPGDALFAYVAGDLMADVQGLRVAADEQLDAKSPDDVDQSATTQAAEASPTSTTEQPSTTGGSTPDVTSTTSTPLATTPTIAEDAAPTPQAQATASSNDVDKSSRTALALGSGALLVGGVAGYGAYQRRRTEGDSAP